MCTFLIFSLFKIINSLRTESITFSFFSFLELNSVTCIWFMLNKYVLNNSANMISDRRSLLSPGSLI